MIESVRALLEGVVDYAGLFPPAALAMEPAVAGYARYRAGPDAWALGRFVVPVSRLGEFADATARAYVPDSSGPWRLSALGGTDAAADVARVERFEANTLARAVIDAFEWKAGDARALRAVAALLPPTVTGYAELSLDGPVDDLIGAAREAGTRVKVRTGGITADAFAPAEALARFVVACTRGGVAFKATAGLHHPLRGRYPLTYDAASDSTRMFGYLNLFLATAFARVGADVAQVGEILQVESPHEFIFTDAGVRWRSLAASTVDLRALREHGAISFGSCSFTEPLTELAALSLE